MKVEVDDIIQEGNKYQLIKSWMNIFTIAHPESMKSILINKEGIFHLHKYKNDIDDIESPEYNIVIESIYLKRRDMNITIDIMTHFEWFIEGKSDNEK